MGLERGIPMSERNRDSRNRWRSRTVGFRVSPEESDQIDRMVALTGVSKQEYLTSNMLRHSITVFGNPRVYKALRTRMELILEELSRLENASDASEEFLLVLELVSRIVADMKNE